MVRWSYLFIYISVNMQIPILSQLLLSTTINIYWYTEIVPDLANEDSFKKISTFFWHDFIIV